MGWISWSQTWVRRQQAGNLRDAVRQFCVENECTCFCKPIKGQSKTTKTYSCQLIHKNFTHRWKKVDWCWARRLFSSRLPSVKTTEYSSSSWSSTSKSRWSDWILESKGISLERSWAFSTLVWWTVEEYNGKRRRKQSKFKYCTDPSRQEVLYLRALQGHSGRNLICPSLQDNVLIPNDFFEYIYHKGCAINLHSITNSGLILGGQNLSKRQTAFFSSVDPMNKEHKDPDEIDLNPPRLAWYKQKAWKKHQDTVYWVDIKLAQRKRFKFYQTRSNGIILCDTLPAYCISKAIMMETGDVTYEKVYASLRPPPKISFKDNWMKELDSEAGSNKDSQRIQPKPKTQLSRIGNQNWVYEQRPFSLVGQNFSWLE